MELKLDEEGSFTYEGDYKERTFVRKGDRTWKGHERSIMYKEGVMVHFYTVIFVYQYIERYNQEAQDKKRVHRFGNDKSAYIARM